MLTRPGNLDELTVRVEASGTPDVRGDEELGRRLAERVKNRIGVTARVEVLPPGALERSLGKAKRISDIMLAEYGFYVQPINYPTVPRGTERLRFTPGPTHSAAMQDELTGALVEIWSRLEMQQAA